MAHPRIEELAALAKKTYEKCNELERLSGEINQKRDAGIAMDEAMIKTLEGPVDDMVVAREARAIYGYLAEVSNLRDRYRQLKAEIVREDNVLRRGIAQAIDDKIMRLKHAYKTPSGIIGTDGIGGDPETFRCFILQDGDAIPF